jgi:hypothetical protein
VPEKQRKVPWNEPPVRDEPVWDAARPELRDCDGKEVRRQRLATGEYDGEGIEQSTRVVEHPPEESEIEMLDPLLERAAYAVGAVQVAEVRELEADGEGARGYHATVG